MIKLAAGLLFLPSSVLLMGAACAALSNLARRGAEARLFLCGFGGFAAAWVLGKIRRQSVLNSLLRRLYVWGHEWSHAAAAWGSGGKVFGLEVGSFGGRTKVDRAGAFVSLFPYCVPLYACALASVWRLFVFPSGRGVFLILMGAALAFHWIMTAEALGGARQPDLDAAGGTVFSLALIAAANGAGMLVFLKLLFPAAVSLGAVGRWVGAGSRAAWGWVWRQKDRMAG